MTHRFQRNFLSFGWFPVRVVLRSSAFGLITLMCFSTVAVGEDYIRACQLPSRPQEPVYGRLGRLPDIPTGFDFSFLSTGGIGNAPGPGGGFGPMSGGGTPPPCEEIDNLDNWFNRSLPDTTPPTAGNLTPASGSSVDGLTLILSLDAQDENPLAFRVLTDDRWLICQTTQFYDAQTHKFTLTFPVEFTGTTTPAGLEINKAWLAQGTRNVAVEVYDKAGNKTTLTATYNVSNAANQQALDEVQGYVNSVNANIPENERAPLLADANLMQVMADQGVSTYGQFATAIQQYLDATANWNGTTNSNHGPIQWLTPGQLQQNHQKWQETLNNLTNLSHWNEIKPLPVWPIDEGALMPGGWYPWGELVSGGAIIIIGYVVASAAHDKAGQAAGNGCCWCAVAWDAVSCIGVGMGGLGGAIVGGIILGNPVTLAGALVGFGGGVGVCAIWCVLDYIIERDCLCEV